MQHRLERQGGTVSSCQKSCRRVGTTSCAIRCRCLFGQRSAPYSPQAPAQEGLDPAVAAQGPRTMLQAQPRRRPRQGPGSRYLCSKCWPRGRRWRSMACSRGRRASSGPRQQTAHPWEATHHGSLNTLAWEGSLVCCCRAGNHVWLQAGTTQPGSEAGPGHRSSPHSQRPPPPNAEAPRQQAGSSGPSPLLLSLPQMQCALLNTFAFKPRPPAQSQPRDKQGAGARASRTRQQLRARPCPALGGRYLDHQKCPKHQVLLAQG